MFRAVNQDIVEAVNLLAQGKRNYMCGEVGHAANQLQEACRLLYASALFLLLVPVFSYECFYIEHECEINRVNCHKQIMCPHSFMFKPNGI